MSGSTWTKSKPQGAWGNSAWSGLGRPIAASAAAFGLYLVGAAAPGGAEPAHPAPAPPSGVVDRIEGNWVVVVGTDGEERAERCPGSRCESVVVGASWPLTPRGEAEAEERSRQVRTLLGRLRALPAQALAPHR